MSSPLDEFLGQLQASVEDDTFRSAVLCDRLKSANANKIPRKQTLRAVKIKDQLMLQWEMHFDKQRMHNNLTLEETIARFNESFGKSFREAYLFTATSEYKLRSAKKGAKLTQKQLAEPIEGGITEHNRTKKYLIPEGKPCPFLQHLGIMTKIGHVRQSKQKKFRQINRYLEIVNDIYPQLPETGPLHIVDFGCGLSYLTFAVHHLLTQIHRREVVLTGIDQNEDVISRCRALSEELHLKGLNFTCGTIEQTPTAEQVHLAISLHACDTATDAALKFAVNSQANVILAVPCCQHELFTQIDNEGLNLILKHGILKERVSTIATDALRAAALESAGYKTQIMEFIDLEHTPKNLLIRAVKREQADLENNESASSAYEQLKRSLGIQQLSTDGILQFSESMTNDA